MDGWCHCQLKLAIQSKCFPRRTSEKSHYRVKCVKISEWRKVEKFPKWKFSLLSTFRSDEKLCSLFCGGWQHRNSLMELFIFTNFHLYANWRIHHCRLRTREIGRSACLLFWFIMNSDVLRWSILRSRACLSTIPGARRLNKRAKLESNLCNTWFRAENRSFRRERWWKNWLKGI